MDYINHGTLIDSIDYARLIEYQASLAFRTKPLKVLAARPSKTISKGQSVRNTSTNSSKHSVLTKRRKVLSK